MCKVKSKYLQLGYSGVLIARDFPKQEHSILLYSRTHDTA